MRTRLLSQAFHFTCLLSTALLAAQAVAIGFSPIQATSKLGEPLDARAEVILAPGEDATAQCLSVQPAANGDGRFLYDLQLQLTGTGATRQLRFTTAGSVADPAVRFVLRSTCAGVVLSREYKLLLDPGVFQDSAAIAPATTPAPIAQAKRLSQVLQRPQVVTQSGDTLRALSHRFGGDTKPKRKAFIAALRQTNPMVASYTTTDALPKSLTLTLP
jgi:Tfp pilus assembly protein FimV